MLGTAPPRQDPTEVFQSLEAVTTVEGGQRYVSGLAVREWALTHPFGVDCSNDELATAWDQADSTKVGRLDQAGFLKFWRALETCARRRRAADMGVSVSEVEPLEESACWNVEVDDKSASELVALTAACCRRDDGEDGEWCAAHVRRVGKAIGVFVDAAAWGILSALTCDVFDKRQLEVSTVLAQRLRAQPVEALVVRGLVAAQVAASTYDARARRCVARVAFALGYPREWLGRVEAGIAKALADDGKESGVSAASRMKYKGDDAQSTLVKYAKVGGVGLAAATAIAFTAGLAAPAVAAALATSTAFGASALVTFAGSYSVMFALTFGAAGGGLAGYRMRRRVAGVTDFEFTDDEQRATVMPSLALVVGVCGSMRHVHDHSVQFGLAPPRVPATLELRTRRAVAQLCDSTDPEWIQRRSTDILNATTVADDPKATERNVAAALFGDPEADVDAKHPPQVPLDTLGHRAQAALAAVVTGEQKSMAMSRPFEGSVLSSVLEISRSQLALCNIEDEDTTSQPDSQSVVALASQLYEAAFKRATAEQDEQNEHKVGVVEPSEQAPVPKSSWKSRIFGNAAKENIKDSEQKLGATSDSTKASKVPDIPLWWWCREYGERSGSEMHCLVWERSLLVEVTGSMRSLARSLATSGARESIILGASTSAAAAVLMTLAVPIYLIQATKYIDSTWTLAIERADAAGVALADALCATEQIGTRPATLIGYSLGARVVFKCLETLANRHEEWRKACVKREESQVGTLWVTALDGVHWLEHRSLTRCRLGVRARSSKTSSSRLSLIGERHSAEPGQPIIWCETVGGRPIKKRKPDLKLPSLPDDAIIDVVLVDDDSNFFTKSADNVEILAQASLTGCVKSARRGLAPHIELVPLRVLSSDQNAEPAATIRLELRWSSDGAEAHTGSHEQDHRQGFHGIVEHAILLGAPLKGPSSGAAERARWNKATSVVAGQLCNVYSKNDLMLAIMFRAQSWAAKVAGLSAAESNRVRNVDVSNLINDHSEYPRQIKEILHLLDFDNPELEP